MRYAFLVTFGLFIAYGLLGDAPFYTVVGALGVALWAIKKP